MHRGGMSAEPAEGATGGAGGAEVSNIAGEIARAIDAAAPYGSDLGSSPRLRHPSELAASYVRWPDWARPLAA